MEDGVGSNNTSSSGSSTASGGSGSVANDPFDGTVAADLGLSTEPMGFAGQAVTTAVDALSTGGAVLGAGFSALADALTQATVDIGALGIYGATSEPVSTTSGGGFGDGSESFGGSVMVADYDYSRMGMAADTSWDRG